MERFRIPVPVALCLLAALALAACSDDPKEPSPEPGPIGSLVEASGCKSLDPALEPASLPNDRGFLFWSYDVLTNRLRVEFVNAGLNCCPQYTAGITVEDSQLTITVDESEGLCSCLCLFDFVFEVTDLPVGIYEIVAEEEYLEAGDLPLEGVIDLTRARFGTIQAVRDHYPWGLDYKK